MNVQSIVILATAACAIAAVEARAAPCLLPSGFHEIGWVADEFSALGAVRADSSHSGLSVRMTSSLTGHGDAVSILRAECATGTHAVTRGVATR